MNQRKGSPRVTLIAAVDDKYGIGKNGDIPWKILEDLRHFQKTTLNSVVIMGRLTWKSLRENPLSNRHNIVVSESIYNSIKDKDGAFFLNFGGGTTVSFVKSIPDALEVAMKHSPGKEVFGIGGSQIYQSLTPYADRILLTRILGDYKCDTYFPFYTNFNISSARIFAKLSSKVNVFEYDLKKE